MQIFYAREGFGANIRRLLTGTSLSQAINTAFAPILTRIYTPDDYGVLAIFITTSAVISIFATLNYEVAAMLPEDDDEAWTLSVLSAIFALAVSLLTLVLLLLFGKDAARLVGAPAFSHYLVWVPLGVFLLAVNRALEIWLSRTLRYTLLAGSKVAGSSVGAVTKLGLGLAFRIGAGGLIAGVLMCEVGKIIWVAKSSIRGEVRFLRDRWRELLARHANFPRYQLWASILEFMGVAVPIYGMAHLFGTTIVGFYDLGFRMVFLPLELVVQSVRQVFYQKSVQDLREQGSVSGLVERTGSRLAALSFFPFLFLALTGPTIFSFVFGSDWTRAGLYAQMLAPAFFLRCIVSPTLVFNTFNRQNQYLNWQIIHFAVIVAALGVGGWFHDDRLAVACLSFGTCVTHLYLIYLNCRLAGASIRRTIFGYVLKSIRRREGL